MPGDAATVPAQQGFGSHDPAVAKPAGESGCDRAENSPVVVIDGWPLGLAAQHRELVAKHDDLEVLGTA